jgi:hypothetical protein
VLATLGGGSSNRPHEIFASSISEHSSSLKFIEIRLKFIAHHLPTFC